MNVFSCPGCNARYRLPDGAAGKKVRCKKCGMVSRIPNESEDDEGPLRIADESGLFGEAAAAAAARSREASQLSSMDEEEDERPWADTSHTVGGMGSEHGLARTFWGDVGWSFLFISNTNNAVTFGVVWVISLLGNVARFAPCCGILATTVINGWVFSFLFNCAAETAVGEDELPAIRATEGWWDDVIMPVLKAMLVAAIAFGPASLYLATITAIAPDTPPPAFTSGMSISERLETAPLLLPFYILVLGGAFLLPMIILIVALGNTIDVIRIDLIMRTIARTFIPYVVTCALVLVSQVLFIALQAGALTGINNPTLSGGIALFVLLNALLLYSNVMSMRIIGLYYRHNRQGFAFAWE